MERVRIAAIDDVGYRDASCDISDFDAVWRLARCRRNFIHMERPQRAASVGIA
jgi:hypothetical protein